VGIRLVTERVGSGAGRPVFDTGNGEELILEQPGVAIVLGDRPPESPGTLYISTRQVVWLSDEDRRKGYGVDFLSMSLHAVSTDPESYPSPCIYTQIDNGDVDREMEEDSDVEGDDILDLSKISEMRLVPSDPNQLDTLFSVFCECAELNPDPTEDEDTEHDWVFNVDHHFEDSAPDDEDSELVDHRNATHSIGENGNRDLAGSVVQLRIDDQRFEDAEE
ncbi:hypothetical protein M569_16042, partial [Genlisea aurea]